MNPIHPPTQTESNTELASLDDFESAARQHMNPVAYDYVAGGAADELTVRWNRDAYARLALHPRILVDVNRIDTATTLLGRHLEWPVLLAPTALHRLVHPEGEVETARGASAAGMPFVVSSFSTRRMKDIAAATTSPLWFQFYDLSRENHAFVRDLVPELESLGCQALCVTVDAPVPGARNRLVRNRFRIPDDFETPYFPGRTRSRSVTGLPILGSFTWDDVAWLRSITSIPVVLKGVMTPEDAVLAVRAGVHGIIISNHGGRCLDTLPATIDVLPAIAQAVEGRMPLLVDGGIRRGTDVLKALALGARAVLIGRPYLFGLATAGAAGVHRVATILRDEFMMAMALTGCRSVSEIRPSVLGPSRS